MWDLKLNTIIEFAGYDTLTMNELFSKLNATEVDNQTRTKLNGAPPSKSIALVTGYFFIMEDRLAIKEQATIINNAMLSNLSELQTFTLFHREEFFKRMHIKHK